MKLPSLSKIIKIKYSENIYNFLVFILENNIYLPNDLDNFSIPVELEELFINFWVILVWNSWREIQEFDILTFNPSFYVKPISFKKLDNIKEELENGLNFLNQKNLKEENLSNGLVNFNFNSKDFIHLKSTRHSNKKKNINVNINKIIKFVFEKTYTKSNKSFF